MHPALKVLIGALMVVVGVFSMTVQANLDALVTIIRGSIGPMLVVIGAFIVWLESDEWKMLREKESRGVQQQFQPSDTVASEEPEEEEEETEGHTCPQCGKTFDTERGLNIHRAQKHD